MLLSSNGCSVKKINRTQNALRPFDYKTELSDLLRCLSTLLQATTNRNAFKTYWNCRFSSWVNDSHSCVKDRKLGLLKYWCWPHLYGFKYQANQLLQNIIFDTMYLKSPPTVIVFLLHFATLTEVAQRFQECVTFESMSLFILFSPARSGLPSSSAVIDFGRSQCIMYAEASCQRAGLTWWLDVSCAEHFNQPAEGGKTAETSSPTSETGPLLSVQRRRADAAHGYVYRAGTLARLCLVFHWTRGTPEQRRQLDCWSVFLSLYVALLLC